MFEIYQRLDHIHHVDIADEIPLDHLLREKSRFRIQTKAGVEARVILERGKPLLPGDILLSACGKQLLVSGAPESVVTARTDDWATFSRACYHLGNRHVRLQLGERWLRITPDHVLEDLLSNLGLKVVREDAVFEPEPGAYDKHQGPHAH